LIRHKTPIRETVMTVMTLLEFCHDDTLKNTANTVSKYCHGAALNRCTCSYSLSRLSLTTPALTHYPRSYSLSLLSLTDLAHRRADGSLELKCVFLQDDSVAPAASEQLAAENSEVQQQVAFILAAAAHWLCSLSQGCNKKTTKEICSACCSSTVLRRACPTQLCCGDVRAVLGFCLRQ
jgi:hypothetical protein